MADLNAQLNQVRSNESFLEKMARFIPGYNGYVNRDNARELDTQLRSALAVSLDANHMKLKNTILNLSQRGKLFESDGIDKLDKKLQTATAKFRSASRGYSGAFDVVKIKEDKLNQVYQFDSNMIDGVTTITGACAEMENNAKSDVDIKPSMEKIGDMLDNLIRQFDERESILSAL
jgi:hypothetical protein